MNNDTRTTITGWQVQFEMPVDKPANNVRIKRGRHKVTFFVPINFPDIHNLTYEKLMDAVDFAELFPVSSTLNNTGQYKEKFSIKSP